MKKSLHLMHVNMQGKFFKKIFVVVHYYLLSLEGPWSIWTPWVLEKHWKIHLIFYNPLIISYQLNFPCWTETEMKMCRWLYYIFHKSVNCSRLLSESAILSLLVSNALVDGFLEPLTSIGMTYWNFRVVSQLRWIFLWVFSVFRGLTCLKYQFFWWEHRVT